MSKFTKGNKPWNFGINKKDDIRLSKNTKYSNYTKPYIKNCGDCGNSIEYSTVYYLINAIENNRKCIKCARKGAAKNFGGVIYKRTDKINKKCRLSAIKRIEKSKINGGQLYPNYNKNSINLIESKAKELGIDDIQHAENGGEVYIKELGYWLDGYSKKKNIVIEYDEPHHFNINGELRKKDKKRQNEIIDFLQCTFIRIK